MRGFAPLPSSSLAEGEVSGGGTGDLTEEEEEEEEEGREVAGDGLRGDSLRRKARRLGSRLARGSEDPPPPSSLDFQNQPMVTWRGGGGELGGVVDAGVEERKSVGNPNPWPGTRFCRCQ